MHCRHSRAHVIILISICIDYPGKWPKITIASNGRAQMRFDLPDWGVLLIGVLLPVAAVAVFLFFYL